jgi:hypothetical protein
MAALAFLISSAPAGAGPEDTDKLRKELFALINEVRASKKIAPLKSNAILETLAQKHAENMARQEKLDHDLDGKTSSDRAREAKYPGVVGENVLLSRIRKGMVKTAVIDWLGSPGHRRNILGANWIETGVGAALSRTGRVYFCQVFGLPGNVKTKDFAAIVNSTPDTVRIIWNKGDKPYEIPRGQALSVPFELPKEGRVISLLAADPTAEPIPITLHNGRQYVITRDGKQYKVREVPRR